MGKVLAGSECSNVTVDKKPVYLFWESRGAGVKASTFISQVTEVAARPLGVTMASL